MVGDADMKPDSALHSFIRDKPGDFHLIDVPGLSVPCTSPRWINERGENRILAKIAAHAVERPSGAIAVLGPVSSKVTGIHWSLCQTAILSLLIIQGARTLERNTMIAETLPGILPSA
jgi:hypothetical protein